MNKIFISIIVLGLVGTLGADPKPQIADMLLTAQQGKGRSDTTRSILQVGAYLYASGEPGLQTLHIDAKTGKLTLTDDWTKSSHKMNVAAYLAPKKALKPDEPELPGVLYVANWSPGNGIAIFSLKDPAHPTHLKSIKTQSHTWAIDIHDNLLDVAIDDGTITGINTYDITDPQNPRHLNFLDIGDRLVGNVARKKNFMYFTHKKWLYVYDASDVAKPKRIREIAFNGLAGKVMIRGEHLYMLSRKIGEKEEGGLHVLSLEDASHPKQVAHWSQEEPRDMHFQGDRVIVPCSGSGIYTIDVSDPMKPRQAAHWYLSWPDSGKHPGYAVCVTGDGKSDFVFLGTTAGNNPECRDAPKCPYGGGRVYAVKLLK